jgi:hypothetical protein
MVGDGATLTVVTERQDLFTQLRADLHPVFPIVNKELESKETVVTQEVNVSS